MEVKVSVQAMRYVLARGGILYLWTDNVGKGFGKDRIGFEQPTGVSFELIWDDVIQIFFDEGVAQPNELRVDRKMWPLRGLKIHWDDRLWGWRGFG